MNTWSHFPNARHIDRVIESVKTHFEIWVAASLAASSADPQASSFAALVATRSAVNELDMDPVTDAVWDAATEAAWNAAKSVEDLAVLNAAPSAALALIAYDDSAKHLDMSSEQLRVWAIISEDPAATLLLPAVIAFERINELETV